jgi:hypothetical protein
LTHIDVLLYISKTQTGDVFFRVTDMLNNIFFTYFGPKKAGKPANLYPLKRPHPLAQGYTAVNIQARKYDQKVVSVRGKYFPKRVMEQKSNAIVWWKTAYIDHLHLSESNGICTYSLAKSDETA